MNRSVVALGGPPGSGKSTAGRLVAAELGLEFRSVGEVFRAQARERGMDLAAYGRYAESHPQVDRELDRAMASLARPGVLLDGRIQGPLLRRQGIDVAVVAVTAQREERARRLAGRDGLSVEEAAGAIRTREASEHVRYLQFYGIDPEREPVDLLVDSTSLAPEAVAAQIVAFLRQRWGEADA